MIAHLQRLVATRIAERSASQRGFITMQVLAISLLLLVAAGGLVGAAQATIHTSREGQSFTQARRALDYGQSYIEAQMNDGLVPIYYRRSTNTMEANSDSEGYEYRERYDWQSNPANATVEITTTIDGIGTAPDTTETASVPVRGTLVASRDTVTSTTGNSVSYGIPAGPSLPGDVTSNFASGLWGRAVSTSAGTSNINGTIYSGAKNGTWAVFGGTVTNGARARVVTYTDSMTSIPPNSSSFNRSRINAYMDTRISDQLMSNVRTWSDCLWYDAAVATTDQGHPFFGYGCRKGDLTYPTLTREVSGGGVSTHVIRGNVVLAGDISIPNGELHLYVDGDVTFGDAAAPGTRDYSKVFIYAPNGTCRAASGVAVRLTGSLACKTVVLNQGAVGANAINWARPGEQPNAKPYTLAAADPSGKFRPIDTPKVIHYFERPGFQDQWSQ